MPVISERLKGVLQVINISITNKPPSPRCSYVGRGFCSSKDECHVLAVLENQATDGGISDQRLNDAARTMSADAIQYGCNVLKRT